MEKLHIAIILIVLFLLFVYNKNEHLDNTTSSSEAILNLASMYNNEEIRATRLTAMDKISGKNIEASERLFGKNIESSERILGKNVNVENNLVLQANAGFQFMPICRMVENPPANMGDQNRIAYLDRVMGGDQVKCRDDEYLNWMRYDANGRFIIRCCRVGRPTDNK